MPLPLNDLNSVYRALQRHLDDQAIGFPATSSNADIKLLKHIFSPDEAVIATCLTYKPQSLDAVFNQAQKKVATKKELAKILDQMEKKGGIETGGSPDNKWYRNAPLVVGMYEYQLGRLSPEFVKDFNDYTSDRKFGISFLSSSLPQMRTIPIEKSISVKKSDPVGKNIPIEKSIPIKNYVQDFDSVVDMLKASNGPFAICECICRKKQTIMGNPCKVTDRLDTCLAVGNLADTAIRIKMGRQINLDDAILILEKNQDQGLVLQPSNTQTIDFICSCCGCCCGMLRMQKQLPKPLDFWVSNFFAKIDTDACNGCGRCEKRCQVDAISMIEKQNIAVVDMHRCIGCGLCVPVCKANAISLIKKEHETIPPRTREDLYDIIKSGKKGSFGKIKLTGKLVVDAILTGNTRILK